MNDEDKKLLHATQCGEIYMAYGEFCVRFERLSDRISSSIATLLLTEGLTNYNIANILLSGLTANPLVELYNSLLNEKYCFNKTFRVLNDFAYEQATAKRDGLARLKATDPRKTAKSFKTWLN